MKKGDKPKDYQAELRASRLSLRWKSDDGDRQFHREFVMPKSPRATTQAPSSNPAKPNNDGNRRWPF